MDTSEFIFDKRSLDPTKRKAGISAFMRIKNGEAFLRESIESHISFFDEIVACYNDCSDNTEAILLELQKNYPERLKVYHYVPKAHPPGSDLHRSTPGDSVNSLVNFYNYALSKTSYTIATKLDDDHLAIAHNLKRAIDYIKNTWNQKSLLVYSGLNIIPDSESKPAIYKNNMFSGNADICFFPVSTETYFVHDERFELFTSNIKQKKYVGLLYFHLKFLKENYGFNNYDIVNNPDSRYAKMYEAFVNTIEYITFDEFTTYIKSPNRLLKNYNKYKMKLLLSKIFKNIDTYKIDRAKTLELDFISSQPEIDRIKQLSCFTQK